MGAWIFYRQYIDWIVNNIILLKIVLDILSFLLYSVYSEIKER
jgi:hypothetical protein